VKRDSSIQFYRAIAIIAVVMIHTCPSGYWQVFLRPFINFCVASFIFLSGYLTKVENNCWSHFFKKRIIKVAIPYIIWTILYTLASKRLYEFPYNLLTGQASIQFYYIFVYIQFVLLTPFLGKLLKSKYSFLGWLISPLSLFFFKYLGMFTGFGLDQYVSLIWSVSCFGWFVFYYLGLALGNNIIKKDYSLNKLIYIYIGTIILQIVECYVWMNTGIHQYGTQLSITAILTSSVFCFIIYTTLKNKIFNINNRIILLIGDYSFGIYLCHLLVRNALPYYKHIPFPVTTIVVVVCSLLCCYIGNKICGERISKWIGISKT